VYIAIDTVVPETPQFEFLRKAHFRIRTCRLRKQLSQGIVFPTAIIQNQQEWTDGQDVTELVGVRKYEKPIPVNMAGMVKGSFPSYVPKTDEIMLQSIPNILKEIAGKDVYISVKCDGTSCTFGNFNGEIDVCSRKLSLKDAEGNLYWQIFKKYNIAGVFEKNPNIAIQGEVCGPSIQKNRLGLKEHELFVFQVYDIKSGKYLNYADFIEFCRINNLQTVPILNTCTFDFTMEEMIEMAKGVYANGQLREGIVVRPLVECYSPSVDNHDDKLRGRMSFKVLNNDFLEKNKE